MLANLIKYFAVWFNYVIFARLFNDYDRLSQIKSRLEGGRLRSELFNEVFMYAIVDIAGQQFKVESGKEIFVNRLKAGKDAVVEFDKVLLIDDNGAVKVGSPYLDGIKVKATVLDDNVKADKILVFKKIRRKGFQKLNGHRQKLTKIQINEIA